MRLALSVEYDGSNFHGWQFQPKQRTVQGELQKAVSLIANTPTEVFAAGRTDTGVHALNQVVHFDTEAIRQERNWLLGLNSNLPHDISIK